MSLPWQENVDSDQFHRDIEWDLGRTDYEPATGAYVAPWDRQGWGGNDVALTPPRTPGGYVPPSRPGIQEGQRDYVFMPTEKEQWRTEDENKRRQALAVGKDWKEARLPRKEREVTYIPTDKERNRESRNPREEDRRVYAGRGSPIRGVSGHDYLNNPKYKDHREKQPRRPSLRDTLVADMRHSWR